MWHVLVAPSLMMPQKWLLVQLALYFYFQTQLNNWVLYTYILGNDTINIHANFRGCSALCSEDIPILHVLWAFLVETSAGYVADWPLLDLIGWPSDSLLYHFPGCMHTTLNLLFMFWKWQSNLTIFEGYLCNCLWFTMLHNTMQENYFFSSAGYVANYFLIWLGGHLYNNASTYT